MSRNGTSRVSDVESAYNRSQTPTDTNRTLARSILLATGDPTAGSTHYYSPRSMPREGGNTAGFDVGGGLELVSPLTYRTYRPSWALTFEPRTLGGVRAAYFKFYKAPGTGPVR